MMIEVGEKFVKMEKRLLYEVLNNNVLLLRRREIDREEERETFDGTTES